MEKDFQKKLGKYTIKSELGRGSMGIVYEGFDPDIERTLALKTIRKDMLDRQELDDILARFKREAQAAGRLAHPNIVGVYEYGDDEDTAFIAMELVHGRELQDFFDKGERFDLSDVIRIMSQLLGALSYSHQNGVIHRDIKPANIILTDNMQIKITDFGIAHIESSRLTQTGTVMGTPSYMSPEQFSGQGVDSRSDIFSAGVILYQFITGENPFIGSSMATIMHKVMNVDPVNPSDLNIRVSSFDAVIKKAIAKNPDQRFQTAEDFFEAISKAVQSEPVVSTEQRDDETEPDLKDTVILSPENRAALQARTKEHKKDLQDADMMERIPSGSKRSRSVIWLMMLILVIFGGILLLNFFREKPGVDSTCAVDINTNPQGAAVFINDRKFVGKTSLDTLLYEGKKMGETPLLIELGTGIYEIILKKDGYYDFSAELEVESAMHIPFEVELIKINSKFQIPNSN